MIYIELRTGRTLEARRPVSDFDSIEAIATWVESFPGVTWSFVVAEEGR